MQKLKTRVIKKDVNPEWNEDLTLSVTDPSIPIKLVSASAIAPTYLVGTSAPLHSFPIVYT